MPTTLPRAWGRDIRRMTEVRAVPQPSRDRRRTASAASWAREETCSLVKTWATWVCTVRGDTNSRSPIWGFGQPLHDQVHDLALGGGEALPAQLWSLARAPANRPGSGST